jgi:transcriptional regulator with XRE-family HTH domain
VDLVRLGLGIRALRRRRGWRQKDLAAAARVGQTLVSLIERGHVDQVSIPALQAVAAAVDARLTLEIRWRAGDLDRLLDSDHARLSATFVDRLRADGWESRVEVTYATPRSYGSIDVLAWHAPTRTLLVIEIKTAIPSAEATLRKLDEKVAVAANVARQRFGWVAAHMAHVLVVEDTSTNRRRMDAHAALFEAALPRSGAGLRRWLADPVGAVAGRLFLSPSAVGAAIQHTGGRHRVRRPAAPSKPVPPSVEERIGGLDDNPERPSPSILVGYERRDR